VSTEKQNTTNEPTNSTNEHENGSLTYKIHENEKTNKGEMKLHIIKQTKNNPHFQLNESTKLAKITDTTKKVSQIK
jgi:hypothetical protein